MDNPIPIIDAKKLIDKFNDKRFAEYVRLRGKVWFIEQERKDAKQRLRNSGRFENTSSL